MAVFIIFDYILSVFGEMVSVVFNIPNGGQSNGKR